MKKIIFLVFSCLLVLLTIGCTKTTQKVTTKNPKGEITGKVDVNKQYLRYDVTNANDYPIVGFGAQIDTDVYMPWNNMSEEDEAEWEKRIKDMNLKYTRIKYFPEYLERGNDNDDPNVFNYDSPDVDFNCAEMLALYKILDICEKYDIKVDLSVSGCWHNFVSYDGNYTGSWLASEYNGWVTGPTDYDEYAENVSVVLDYLLNTKHYTCIWGISNISESFFNEKGVKDWSEYVESCQVIKNRLIKDGLKDKVLFIGAGENNIPKYYKEEFETVKDIFDVCGMGNYNWDYTCDNESIYNYFVDQVANMKYFGKENLALAEFCQGKHFLDAVNKTDIDDYSAGLYIARFCIEASRAGVTAFDHYILGDCWFTNHYIHTMGLWMYRDVEKTAHPEYITWPCHPEYYFYAMICKYVDRGAYAYNLEQTLKSEYDSRDPEISNVAFKLPDGSWTYYIANTGTTSRKVAIVNTKEGHPTTMNCYKITESWIPEDRACVLPECFETVDATNGVCYVTVPANGFLVVSDKTFN